MKWIGADRTVLRIPVATVSVLLLGPGTTVTHAAVKTCGECNTPICWIGEDGMKFYAVGVEPTHDNHQALHQASVHANKKKREEVARRMFRMRFIDQEVTGNSIQTLRGIEGRRVKELYAGLGEKYGVSWKGRNYDPADFTLSDKINKAVSAANHALYALTLSVVCSLGYLPQLGFIHSSGRLPFVYDIADIYKPETSLEAAFQTVGIHPDAGIKDVIARLKFHLEEQKVMRRMPEDIERLLTFDASGDEP